KRAEISALLLYKGLKKILILAAGLSCFGIILLSLCKIYKPGMVKMFCPIFIEWNSVCRKKRLFDRLGAKEAGMIIFLKASLKEKVWKVLSLPSMILFGVMP